MTEKYEAFRKKILEDQKYFIHELKLLTDREEELSKDEREYMNQLMDHIRFMNNTLSSIQYKLKREQRKSKWW